MAQSTSSDKGKQSAVATSDHSSKIFATNKAFAIIWILFEVLFCALYGVYVHTASFDIFLYQGLQGFFSAAGIAILAIIGLGGLMTFQSGLKWSGIGFALLIAAITFQYYFLINAFWNKADIQDTTVTATGGSTGQQLYKNDFLIFLSESYGLTAKTLGATATGAFKCALTITIAFSALVGRSGPLEILILVLFGGFFYELNRQVVSLVAYDFGGSMTIFMFGGIMGTVIALMLSFTKHKNHLEDHPAYTSGRFGSTMAALGSAFFWVFFPALFFDFPSSVAAVNDGPFLEKHGVINSYYAIGAAVTTSLAMSALLHGKIKIKDLVYGPFAGGAIVASSATLIFNPMAAMLLGVIAGILQPLFNIADDKSSRKPRISSNAAFVFGVQGFLGSLAVGIMRAIQENNDYFDYDLIPFPFRLDDSGEYYRATFISFGIALGAGLVTGLFVLLANKQERHDLFTDRPFWLITDDGIRPPKGAPDDGDEIKGIHAYL